MSEKIEIEVVVNGRGYTVTQNENAALQSLIEEALKLAGAQKSAEWVLKDEAGTLLDPHGKLRDLHPVPKKLFLSLKAGVNG